jgi:hypothetical protein
LAIFAILLIAIGTAFAKTIKIALQTLFFSNQRRGNFNKTGPAKRRTAVLRSPGEISIFLPFFSAMNAFNTQLVHGSSPLEAFCRPWGSLRNFPYKKDIPASKLHPK